MRVLSHLICATAIIAITMTTACSADSESQAPKPGVDLSKLETGSFPSAPRDPNTAKVDASGQAIEAVRLAAHVPIPYDIDPSFEFAYGAYEPRATSSLPGSIIGIEKADGKEIFKEVLAGWDTAGQRRFASSAGRRAYIQVLQYETSAKAENSVRRIFDTQRVIKSGTSVNIPDFSTALTTWHNGELHSWLLHKTMVIGVAFIDPMTIPPDPEPAVTFSTKAFKKTIEMLADYTPTPISEMANLPIDVDEMLSRTLPSVKGEWSSEVPEGAVEPAQAALARENNPRAAASAYADAKVDFVATDAYTRVYRAADADAAERLLAGLLQPEREYYKVIESPAHLPNAQCFEARDKTVNSYRFVPICYVQYDRYVARVTSLHVLDLAQRTAAQYKLLAVGR
ncbi:hypothetical protein ACFWUP_18210 [Nocardia sp. NPDC058658]|uniref:DUF7373 family lipoprotein n=1 Tax=Nocardia sp. NPDC058658 TaxID=3346580 RepID=UPI003647F789